MPEKRLMKAPISPEALVLICTKGNSIEVLEGFPEGAKYHRCFFKQLGLELKTIYLVIEHPSFNPVEDVDDSIPEICPVFKNINTEAC